MWGICDNACVCVCQVLDDNHLLTMPSGERISFGSNVNFLFETHNLRFASPATIRYLCVYMCMYSYKLLFFILFIAISALFGTHLFSMGLVFVCVLCDCIAVADMWVGPITL